MSLAFYHRPIGGLVALLVAAMPSVAGAQAKDAFAGCRGQAWAGILPTSIGSFVFSPSAPARPYAISRVSPSIWRFESRAHDGSSSGAGSDRTEMVAQYSRSTSCNTVPWRTDIWQSFAMRVSGQVEKDGKWVVLGQWHAVPDDDDASMSPVLAQSFTDGVFKISTRSDDQRRQTAASTGSPRTVYEDRGFPLNTWVNFVYRIRFDYAGRGILQVWRDGKSIVNLRNVPIGYNDVRGPRYQFGIYRQKDSTSTLAVEFANQQIASASMLSIVSRPATIR
ncbi:polysaccharide lyase [Sphingomonas yunnanensis]|uniref:heparin lyase I family protein n=1 Tax=Sphingomonas yunnanensis TaxID=310400 RepID=UPI001CA61BCA|nr:heparin lyase I family protein [Sphingomonas yunnanensis]MBY9062816.1 polysaccharide lyase [Sphingomonas yunnanensis]